MKQIPFAVPGLCLTVTKPATFTEGQIDFEPQAEKKVKPFSWQHAFDTIFKSGGFDVGIGNPPYVRQELLGEANKKYYSRKYKVYHGTADLYSYFFEKGINMLKPDGLFGIIVANKWMRANYGEPLRKWLKQQELKEIIDFGDLPVFQTATTYPCIVIASKPTGNVNGFKSATIKTLDFISLADHVNELWQHVKQDDLDNSGWTLSGADEQALFKKLMATGLPLGKYVDGNIYRSVLTGLNEAFVINEETKNRLILEDPQSAEVIKPFLAGRDIKRYRQPKSDKYHFIVIISIISCKATRGMKKLSSPMCIML